MPAAKDARIDPTNIQKLAGRMQAAGINVTLRLYENEDHLLILADFERLGADVARCLGLAPTACHEDTDIE